MAVGPEAAVVAAGVGFEGCEFACLVPLGVAPGEAGADEVGIDEVARAIHAADFAAVAVGVRDVDADGLPEDCGGEGVCACVPKAWAFSGASMPARRILCWLRALSSTVSVSPSAIFTTWPTSVWWGVAAQARAAKTSSSRRARRFMAGIVALTLWGGATSRPKQFEILAGLLLHSARTDNTRRNCPHSPPGLSGAHSFSGRRIPHSASGSIRSRHGLFANRHGREALPKPAAGLGLNVIGGAVGD